MSDIFVPIAPAADPDGTVLQPAAGVLAAEAVPAADAAAPKERHHQEGFSKRTVALTTGYVGTGYKGEYNGFIVCHWKPN